MIQPMTKNMTKKTTRQPPQRDIFDALVSFASRERFDRIPERVRAMAKLHIIDGIGVMLAGASAPTTRALVRGLAANEHGSGADIVGTGHTVSAPTAAFANAFSGRVLDYDDVQTTETSIYGLLAHPTVPVLAAALAIGQSRNVSGEALLVAYLAGVEAATRIADTAEPKSLRAGCAPTATFAGIGAVIAATKLLKLKPKAARAALSLWAATTARDRPTTEAPSTTALREAHSVRAAVEAALFVAEGLTVAVPDLPLASDAVKPLALVKNFGNPYMILQPGFAIRVYSSHPLTHPALDLILAIVNLHDMCAGEIKRIEIGITNIMAETLSLKIPTNVSELRRNLPFVVALAACRGILTPDDFDRIPRQKPLLDLMRRIHCRAHPDLDALGHERARTIVGVTLKSGRIIEMKMDVAKGTPQKPLSEIELFHKFFQCALPILDGRKAERLLNRLWLLDEAPQVAGLCKLDARWPTDVEPGNAGGHPHAHDHDDAHGRGHHAHLGHDDPFHGHQRSARPKRAREKK
ncbi:MAG: hypothetical protein FJX37_03220 [Alphaproteobacteria bacterium]|nr:hypothetical protein [Alphaproteobacteria bacterium]